jgi:hypothetical protein
MQHHIEKTLKVNLPATRIWQVMGDFSSVEHFATTIKTSPITNNVPSGIGARRLCTFQDGSSLVEEITEYKEGEGFTMELSQFSLPLKSMNAQMRVKAIDENSSELYMSSEFIVKAGVFGWLMGLVIMKPMMKGVFKKLLTGLAYYTDTGIRVDSKLPAQQQLGKLIIG